MKHGKKVNHLGRKTAHRHALMSNMASSLIKSTQKRVITTLAKAKALRTYVEPLISKSRNDTTHSRRTVFSYLRDKDAVKALFGEVSVKIGNRPGGYTRILKIGPRPGDNAEMALIELVDYNEFLTGSPDKKRTRRGKKKMTTAKTAVTETPSDESAVPETPSVEETVAETTVDQGSAVTEVETATAIEPVAEQSQEEGTETQGEEKKPE